MKIKINHIIILIIVLASLQYFMVSLSSPIVFGDEGFYASLSSWISENHIIPEINPYTQNLIYGEKTAILPIFFLYEIFGFYFGEIGVKLLIPVFSLLAALMVYMLMKSFKNKLAGLIGAIALLMTPAMVTYGVMGYTDTLLILLSLLSINFIIKSFNDNKKIDMMMSGIFIAMSLLTKKSAAFLVLFLAIYGFSSQDNKKIKKILTIILLVIVFISPWIIRNVSLFGDTCFSILTINKGNCGSVFLETPEKIEGLEFEGRTANSGTEIGLLQFGILNYMRFANGWSITLLFLLGLGYVIFNLKDKQNIISASLLLSTLPLILFSTLRVEDTARYMLPMNIGIIMIISVFVIKLYERIKKQNKYGAYILIILILLSFWMYGQEKINTMKSVKQFSPGFIDGCEWVRENTPENSILLATYMYHTRYQCDRSVAIANDAEEIYLTNDETSYQHMKQNGINYIVVLTGLITDQKLKEHYPIEFINYIDNSNKFKKVHDNTDTYGNSGVIVYEVL